MSTGDPLDTFNDIAECDNLIYDVSKQYSASHIYDVNTVYNNNSSNGNITIGPNSSSSGSNITLSSPWSYTTTMSYAEPTYTILKLPRDKMPEKVYAQGMLKTCGLLGTDAECAYTGKDMLIFSPNILPTSNGQNMYIYAAGLPNPAKPTISLEYHDAIYHYVVDHVPGKGEGSTILDVRQVGVVKKGE